MSAVIMAAGTVICMAASAPLIGLFSSNPETIAIGQTALRIICLGFVVSAVSTTSSGALEGLGKGAASLVISLCRYVIFIMPLAWLLCRQLGPHRRLARLLGHGSAVGCHRLCGVSEERN